MHINQYTPGILTRLITNNNIDCSFTVIWRSQNIVVILIIGNKYKKSMSRITSNS